MTKYQLEVEYDYDFILIGISCHAKDYRLCWAVNNALGLALEKEDEDVEILHKKEKSQHSVFSFYHEENYTEYTLVLNRGTHGLLIPEQKQADYMLLIRNNFGDDLSEILSKIRRIDFVLTAFEIDVERLKSKQNLQFK
jgi:hypothetical protein